MENCAEWLYCIDCDDGSVVSWDLGGYVKPEHPCFDDYLLDRLNDAVEDM